MKKQTLHCWGFQSFPPRDSNITLLSRFCTFRCLSVPVVIFRQTSFVVAFPKSKFPVRYERCRLLVVHLESDNLSCISSAGQWKMSPAVGCAEQGCLSKSWQLFLSCLKQRSGPKSWTRSQTNLVTSWKNRKYIWPIFVEKQGSCGVFRQNDVKTAAIMLT